MVRKIDDVINTLEWVHCNINPGSSTVSNNPRVILSHGEALCGGYSSVLVSLLKEKFIECSVIDLIVVGHENGRGLFKIDSHVIVQAKVEELLLTLDPMSGTFYFYSVRALIDNPLLASNIFFVSKLTKNYHLRKYFNYNGPKFYSSVILTFAKNDNFFKKLFREFLYYLLK